MASQQDAIGTMLASIGSARQLALLPAEAAGERRTLPSPLEPLLDELADGQDSACILASGDPMLHGIGASLVIVGVPGERQSISRYLLPVFPLLFPLASALRRMSWPTLIACLCVVGTASGWYAGLVPFVFGIP